VEKGSLGIGDIGHHRRPLGGISLQVLDGGSLLRLAPATDGIHELPLLVQRGRRRLIARQCPTRTRYQLQGEVLDREQDGARAARWHPAQQVLA
jgi:hypothetical protein